MSSIAYQTIAHTLADARAAFETVDSLFATADPTLYADLKGRWQTTLTHTAELAEFVGAHHRAQSAAVLDALENAAKYADPRRPFRLSVIGQKGVGKSALVNALLGAGATQYTPSEVAGKAVSGTRIRLVAAADESTAAWRVAFLTPRRLWEVGTFLLGIAHQASPTPPSSLDNHNAVVAALRGGLGNAATDTADLNSTSRMQAMSARQTLGRMLDVYAAQSAAMPADYTLTFDDPDVDGEIGTYIRQNDDGLYLIVDYVERHLQPHAAGLLAGRRLELEDVLGLDDPRDTFFALEAFREAFAVIMVFKCDRGLNTESSSLLQTLFSRDETELARFGNVADLNKAIIVANQFDVVAGGVTVGSKANPLQGIEDIRRDLNRYTRHPVPVFVTSAQMALTARQMLDDTQARPNAAYWGFLPSLSNVLTVAAERGVVPDYLDDVQARRAEIEAAEALTDRTARASLTLELSGLPRLAQQVEAALDAGSILRGRVANAEYYYSHAIAQTALCYARQMRHYGLGLHDFEQKPVSLESYLFTRFQQEMRDQLDAIDHELRAGYFANARRYIHGAMPDAVTQSRERFLTTIRQVMLTNTRLIRTQEHISTGQTVTDAWRTIFEDINDWLALEAGREMTALVSPVLADVETIASVLQQRLAALGVGALDERFWQGYQAKLARLRQRLQAQADVLAMSYFTQNRFTVFDTQIAQTLHSGDPERRRDDVARLMAERVRTWFAEMWHLLAQVAMTDVNHFVNDVRYAVLGLPALGSVHVEMGIKGRNPDLTPEESLVALLNHRYQTDEGFRRHYALREPTPAERVSIEIRDWLDCVHPPMDGLTELRRATALATDSTDAPEDDAATQPTPVEPTIAQPVIMTQPGYTALRVPVESRHPYYAITRQQWTITNPDPKATHSRVHFSRIELGDANDSIEIGAIGSTQHQTLRGNATDVWSAVFPGRQITVQFNTDSQKPGWGFVLDGIESIGAAVSAVRR